MHGARRVLVFCLLTAVLPTILLIIPLYLRHKVFADVMYAVAESDVIQIDKGISPVFCQEHSLKMNITFHAFQIDGTPELQNTRKHVQLKKSMRLPDDTLEYWGFYLLKGSTVFLSACSRFDGARVLIVKGERSLSTCGLLDHKSSRAGVFGPADNRNIKIALGHHKDEPVEVHYQNSDEYEGEIGDALTEKQEIDKADELTNLEQKAVSLINKHMPLNKSKSNETLSGKTKSRSRKVRHEKRKLKNIMASRSNNSLLVSETSKKLSETLQEYIPAEPVELEDENETDTELTQKLGRKRRQVLIPDHMLDRGIEHGGNAVNYTEIESSESSFETNLLLCYDDQILLQKDFPPSPDCSVNHLLDSDYMNATHQVDEDGYYYYIFYSDNDRSNDLSVIFNLYKITYQYTNFTNGCVNKTECKFPISLMSSQKVIVEIPTRDGIEHEEGDIYLVSTCHPRMAVYIIFPVTVLFLILGCAFL